MTSRCQACGCPGSGPAPSSYDVLKTIQMLLDQQTSFSLRVLSPTEAAFRYQGHLYQLTVERKAA